MSKKLKIFTNHYFPENFRINALSQQFSQEYEVSVVTQKPNYPKGQFFDGYGLFKKSQEIVDGIKVRRLPVIPRGNNSIMLSLNYLSYTMTSFFYRIFSREKVNHVFVYVTSPIFISYAALGYAKKNDVKSTLYLLDLWPGSLISILKIKNKFLIKRLENMCKRIYNRFDNIIVSSEGFIEVLEGYGINRDKIVHIPQHADECLEKPIVIKPIEDKLKVVFTGNIGQAQNLDVLVDTAEVLKSLDFTNVLFTLVGDGRYKTQLMSEISRRGLEDYFEFVGRVAYNEIQGILSNHHFGFVSLGDDETLSRTLPAKVQSYMSFGIPVLASANGEIPNVLFKTKAGEAVSANNANALANKIIELSKISHKELLTMGHNGFNYSNKHYNLETISKQMLKIMKEGILNV